MSFRSLFLLFLIVPLTELYFLITVGDIIGVLPTIGLVIFTAILGAHMLKAQGLNTLQRFQGSLQQGQLPATEIVEGLILLICGALLLTPGFVTDTIGFFMLVPSIRRLVAGTFVTKFKPNISMAGRHDDFQQGPTPDTTHSSSSHRAGDILEGEFKRD